MAVDLFSAVGVMVIAEPLTHPVHQPEAGIRAKYRCIIPFLSISHGLIAQ